MRLPLTSSLRMIYCSVNQCCALKPCVCPCGHSRQELFPAGSYASPAPVNAVLVRPGLHMPILETRAPFRPICARDMTTPTAGCIPKWGRTSPCLRSLRSPNHLAINSESEETAVPSPLFWAVGPIRTSLVRGLRPRNAPLMPIRPGVDIGDRCLIEGVWPDHVPPFPSNPHGDRSCACPDPLNQRTSR